MTEANTIELQADDVVAGRYRICKRLGRGGMGTVYESQQITLDRKVALKVLRPEFAGKEMAAKRFEREAKSASSIDHRNVVNILDFGHLETGELYYTMELLQGRDLSQVLKEQGALPWSRAGWIILQVVRAFAAIHDKGIVHRDLKPANCVLLDPKPGDDPDFIKILDFGIANLQDKTQATALTGASDIIGSAPYMAPEQVEGKEVDARTDIYSLGIMMYELLTGKVPFREQHIYKIMMQHLTEAPQPPRELAPDIPPEVEGIILRAIAKKPEDRYQSMAEIELDLSLFVEKPQASAVMYRTSPSASSADRSAAGSSAGRPMLGTRPGPTGTIAVGSSPSMRATRQDGPAAETTPRVGASFGFNAQTYSEPQRRRGKLLPIVLLVLLAFGGAIGLTVWLKQTGQGEKIAGGDDPDGDKKGDDEKGDDPKAPDPTPLRPQVLDDLPHDPYTNPFGAEPLLGRMGRTKRSDGTEVIVPLEEILRPNSWLLERGSIAGRILSQEEPEAKTRPLANARVCAWVVDPRAPLELRRKPNCTETDRRGGFAIAETAPSFYDLTVSARGFAPQSLLSRDGYPLTVQPKERHDEIEMTLVPGGTEVRGTVKTTIGEPIDSAFVSTVGSVRAVAFTNAAGEFSVWANEGEIALVASARGYADLVARGPADQPFALVLRRHGVLIGQVIDESERPVEMAKVRAGTRKGGLDPVVYTDAKGQFRIDALPEGSYRPVALTADAAGEAESSVDMTEGSISPKMKIVVLKLRKALPEPPEAVGGSTGGDADTGTTTTDGTTGDTGDTGDTDGTGTSDGTGDGGGEDRGIVAGDGGQAPSNPSEPVEPKETPVPPTPTKPVVTDKSLRKSAADKLKRCGTNGTIEVTAKYVTPPHGLLVLPEVTVTGEAAKNPAVKECAKKVAERHKFLPPKTPTLFKKLVVKI